LFVDHSFIHLFIHLFCFRQLRSIDIHIAHTYTEKTHRDREKERNITHSQNTPYNIIITD